MLKFIIFSDIHLVDGGETSLGLDIYRRFATGVDWVNAHHTDADFCVLAGDLADHGFKGAREPCRRLKELVSRLSIPCHVTIENHHTFVEYFGANTRAETGCIDKVSRSPYLGSSSICVAPLS
jgi:3',5'-cyclic-AMP phosphodiesterase